MYSFLLPENSVSFELLEKLNIDHKRLSQLKSGVATFDFKMKLGSTFVERSILREIFLYVTAVVCRDRAYNNAEELLCAIIYIVFWQNSIFCSFESVLINLSCSVKCGPITAISRKKNHRVMVFAMSQPTNFSPLMSVLLQLTHKIKLLPWWFSHPTSYFHTWIFRALFISTVRSNVNLAVIKIQNVAPQ